MLIKNNKILLMRRSNTGWKDGFYSLPSGHVEAGESATASMAREAKEEIGIEIKPDNLEVVHVTHHKSDHDYVDFFFIAEQWQGDPTNREPEKCDDLSWFSLDHLPENLLTHVRQAIKNYQNRICYSEFGW